MFILNPVDFCLKTDEKVVRAIPYTDSWWVIAVALM